jgi:hypothetical protein
MPRSLQLCFLGFILAPLAQAAENWWRPQHPSRARTTGTGAWIRPARGEGLDLDATRMQTALRDVVEQGADLRIQLPVGDGEFAPFALEAVGVMAPALAEKYPEILTVHGVAIDRPGTWARLDWTPQGFHGLIHTPDGFLYIDPWSRGDDTAYACYSRKDFVRGEEARDIRCTRLPGPVLRHLRDAPAYLKAHAQARHRGASTAERRTFRIAITTDHQYTDFHGGETAALAAIVTGLNRINAIYERDLGVRMELVANNDLLVFNATNDPHTGNFAATGIISTRIGALNYDIGHYLSGRHGGSLSALRVVCNIAEKGDGMSASSSPNNDPYWINIVAHEIGHQFGADHTFNSVTDACGGGNRSATSAYEPGSGSTIMAYAGICGADDIQGFSDDYFHAYSLGEIQAYIASSAPCASTTNTPNHLPSVNAGNDYVIPARTPFLLSGSGSDSDGDTLTYTWEQFDLGPAQSLAAPDNGQSPLFRSLPPSVEPTRSLPNLSYLLTGTSNPAERLPNSNRTLHFRLTARDNHGLGGGLVADDMTVQVIDTGAPFGILSPNTAVTLSGSHTVTWNTGGSQAAPIGEANVRILLSNDGGYTYPLVLAASTANDGSETISLPPLTSSLARIRIEAIDNIFFDVSEENFSISPGGTSVALFESAEAPSILDTFGNGNGNGLIDPGENYILFHPVIRNAGTYGGTNIQATLSALSPGVTVVHEDSPFANLPPGSAVPSTNPFILHLDGAYPCGDPILLRLTVLSDQGGNEVMLALPSGTGSSSQTLAYSAYAGLVPPIAIPDDDAAGTNILFNASGLSPNISRVTFRIGGNACSSSSGDTGNGITHDFSGDLVIRLASPGGTVVVLMQNPGAGLGAGPNFCSVELADGAAGSIQDIPDAAGPHVGTYRPVGLLSDFNGEDPNGIWTATIADTVLGDTGSLQEIMLTIEALSSCVPASPTSNLDGDADGMPDEWERFYFGNPTSAVANADSDLDGFDHAGEYIADTDPTNAQSFFKLEAFDPGSSLNVISSPSRVYQLQSASIPGAINWNDEALVNGTGGTIAFPIAPGPAIRFYRIRVDLP